MVSQSFLEYPKGQGAHSMKLIFRVIIVTNPLLHSFYVLVSFCNLELIGIIVTGRLPHKVLLRQLEIKGSLPLSKALWKMVIMCQFCSSRHFVATSQKIVVLEYRSMTTVEWMCPLKCSPLYHVPLAGLNLAPLRDCWFIRYFTFRQVFTGNLIHSSL